MAKFEFVGNPMSHQFRWLRENWLKPESALFWEPGAGKTYAVIHMASARFLHEQIDLVVILCPNSVKQVWKRETDKFSSVPTVVQVYEPGKDVKTPRHAEGKLEYLVVAIESLSQGHTYNRVMAYIKGRNAMCVCDESSRIKTAQSIRTKHATSIGWSCYYRLILTGSPITQGPHDLFAQMRFLDPGIIKMKNFTAFKARYCIMGGFQNRKIVQYQNLGQLMDLVRPYCDVVKLADIADIPHKIYKRLIVSPSKEQLKAIEEIRDNNCVLVPGTKDENGQQLELLVEMALERMTRIQQITGGNIAYPLKEGGYGSKPMIGSNPKLDALEDFLKEDLPEDKKALIWARFTPERDAIIKMLTEKFGEDSFVIYDGRTKDADRIAAIDRFQGAPEKGIEHDPKVRFFVGNQTVAGLGLTLTRGIYSIGYSNTFSAEDRIQMENRNHRTGQEEHCIYVDIEMKIKEDRMIMRAVDGKINLANLVATAITSGENIFDGAEE